MDLISPPEEEVLLTKKGTIRKRKPKKSILYFTSDTEEAIIEYLASKDQDNRNHIFDQRIDYAFHKLAENIIHTFKFYYTDVDTINELKHEVVAFLLEKLHLYDQSKGKAYSYFGTIAKRYLIIYNEKNYKKIKGKGTLEEVDEDKVIVEDLVRESNNDADLNDFISYFVRYMDTYLEKYFPRIQDQKTADVILELFRKRENLEIFNKKAIYIYIREMIDVDTFQITKVIKVLKKVYYNLYNEYYETGFVKI
jgi:hypothetical protein